MAGVVDELEATAGGVDGGGGELCRVAGRRFVAWLPLRCNRRGKDAVRHSKI